MSVVIEDENNMRFLITKGAPEILLPRSTFYVDQEGRKSLVDKRPIENAVNQMAEKALRTIAICIKPLTKEHSVDSTFLEKDLTLDRKSTRLNSSHVAISYAVFCLKKK